MRILALLFFIIALAGAGFAVYRANASKFPVTHLESPISNKYYTKRYVEDAEGQTRHTFKIDGVERVYHAYAKDPGDPTPKPVIILLHGSNRTGVSLVEHWKAMADEHDLILIGPDGWNEKWSMANEGPDFFDALLENVRENYNIDPARIYLFGHSLGAMHALYIAVERSDVFAAAAIHAGMFFEPDDARIVASAKRKIPVAFYVGSKDDKFPLSEVSLSAKAFADNGHPAPLYVIDGHNHWYYTLSGFINAQAWEFLKEYKL